MPFDHRFWVGPLGGLQSLPDVKASISVPVSRIGGMHRSLRGGITVDSFARKRSWTWDYERLMEKQVVFLDALQYGTIPGPIRLIDPYRLNRLPEDIASGGSVTRSNGGFGVDSGSVSYYHPLTAVASADPETLPPGPMLQGMQEWQVIVPSASSNYLYAKDHRYLSGFWRTPVLEGEHLELSAWVLGPSSASVALKLQWFYRDGTSTPVEVVPALEPLQPSTWIKLVGSVTVPENILYCTPFLQTSDTLITPGTSLYTTAWQVASVTAAEMIPPTMIEHCDVPEPAGGWRLGGGAPFVVADVGTTEYAIGPLYGNSLTLYET